MEKHLNISDQKELFVNMYGTVFHGAGCGDTNNSACTLRGNTLEVIVVLLHTSRARYRDERLLASSLLDSERKRHVQTQAVGPVQLRPPHWPYTPAVWPDEGAVVVVVADVVGTLGAVVVVVDDTLVVVDVAWVVVVALVVVATVVVGGGAAPATSP